MTRTLESWPREQVVIQILDKWDFDPDDPKSDYPVRVEITVGEILNEFKKREGQWFDFFCIGSNFRELENKVNYRSVFQWTQTFDDTYQTFHELYPNYERDRQQRVRKLLTYYTVLNVATNVSLNQNTKL